MSKAGSKLQELKFEAVNFDSLFPVLDAVAWLDSPDVKKIAQFTNLDPRTTGKILKNCKLVGVIQVLQDEYSLTLPYPFKGNADQKKIVVREALMKLPIVVHFKQFVLLGDAHADAIRKAATMVGISNYTEASFAPLLKWAKQLDVLEPSIQEEDLVDAALKIKADRRKKNKTSVVAFLSHSSKDKPFVRKLAADLNTAGIGVWLDEQKILVGDSIAEKIGQGLAESDYFIIILSEHSTESAWVQKELNQALITEIEKRKVTILPLKLSECTIPPLIRDKKYADFSKSYKAGLSDLIAKME